MLSHLRCILKKDFRYCIGLDLAQIIGFAALGFSILQ